MKQFIASSEFLLRAPAFGKARFFPSWNNKSDWRPGSA